MATKAVNDAFPWTIRVAGGLTAFCLAATVLFWAQAILIPIALAILLTFLLSPPVIRMQRGGVPKAVAVPLVVVLAIGLMSLVFWVVGWQIVRLAEELPREEKRIVGNITALISLFPQEDDSDGPSLGRLVRKIRQKIDERLKETDEAGATGPFGLGPILVEVQDQETLPQSLAAIVGPVVQPLVTVGLVVVLVIFMLFKREDLRNRLVTLSGRAHLAVTTKALDEAGQRIARYLLMQFVINVTYGLAVTLGLLLIGVDYAALWGVSAAILRYVPYIGPWVAAALPVAYGLLMSGGWTPFWVIGLVIVLELLSNNVMEPLLYGRGVGVSAVAVILSAIFWGWLWGPVGLVLATPLTACLVVAGRYVPALSIFNRVFGDLPEVEPHVVYYQRLLARDEDEAEDVFEDRVAKDGFATACETVIVPALESLKLDRSRGVVDSDQVAYILESIVEHAEDAAPPRPAVARDEADLPLVFLYPLRDLEDEAAVALAAELLAGVPCRVEVASRNVLVSEFVSNVRERKAAGVCLIGVVPGGLARARSLVKRMRTALPLLPIAVGRWGVLPERHRIALQEQGATYVGRTPAELAQHVASMAILKPAEPLRAATNGDSKPISAEPASARRS